MMSPLQVEILLHYYSHGDDYRPGDWLAPALRAAIDGFRDETHLIENVPRDGPLSNPCYRITARGRVFVQHLLRQPLPVQTWVMPDAKN